MITADEAIELVQDLQAGDKLQENEAAAIRVLVGVAKDWLHVDDPQMAQLMRAAAELGIDLS